MLRRRLGQLGYPAYLISSAVFLLPFGRLADMLGRKRLFLAGVVLFGVTSHFAR